MIKERSITKILIISICCTFFLYSIARYNFGDQVPVSFFALNPSKVYSAFHVWQIFTFSLLHTGLMHIFLNGVPLWVFGHRVEKIIGRLKYSLLILFSVMFVGISITLCSYVTNRDTPYIGISGLVFALISVLAIISPDEKIFHSSTSLVKKSILLLFLFGVFRFFGTEGFDALNLLIFVIGAIGSIFLYFTRLKIGYPVYLIFILLNNGFYGNVDHFSGAFIGLVLGLVYLFTSRERMKTLEV